METKTKKSNKPISMIKLFKIWCMLNNLNSHDVKVLKRFLQTHSAKT